MGKRRLLMLYWAGLFLIIGIIAGVLGLAGVAGGGDVFLCLFFFFFFFFSFSSFLPSSVSSWDGDLLQACERTKQEAPPLQYYREDVSTRYRKQSRSTCSKFSNNQEVYYEAHNFCPDGGATRLWRRDCGSGQSDGGERGHTDLERAPHQRHGQRDADAHGWRKLLGQRYGWEGSETPRRCEHETG